MKVSCQWLREWVDAGEDVPALAHALTMAGLEVEGIARVGPALAGVVVGEVRSAERHPDADKLRVCRVFDGRQELQIVCGAPNVRVGMKAPLAQVGAKLPNGTQIKQAKLRGVESAGMLCSARELGLSEESAGLFDLPSELPAGQDLTAALALDDSILEINLTPNRGDCMSVAGVAREVAAIRSRPLHPPADRRIDVAVDDTFPVRLEGGEGCPKFVGRIIRGLRPGAQAPFWIQERLRRSGIRPISAAVDVTNYVMLELGQPMHAYDLHKLTGAVVVRFAKAGEKLQLLDGRTVELTPDVLTIADERAIIGMAGVMGGELSGIGDATADVFLEVAFFNPGTIAGRGRRYGLVTDASQRFERGVDPLLQERAIERATQLLIECAGGRAGPVVVTRTDDTPSSAAIRLRHARAQHVLGAKIAAETVVDCLRRLGMTVESAEPQATAWSVRPPSWRFDLRIEEDLIEEVARLHGFDNIPERHADVVEEMVPWTENRVRNERAADLLVDRGYQEAITYSFTDAALQSVLFPDVSQLALANPISAELGAMRVSLWPGLLQAVRDNQRRQQTRVRLFEIGRRFDGGETEVIAGVAAGFALPEQWDIGNRTVDFFDVKADVEALLALSGELHTFIAETHPALHPGQSARIWRGDRAVGWLGALHPEHVKRLDLTYPVIAFELETAGGLAAKVPQYREISRFPAIRRDVAAVVDEAVQTETIKSVVTSSAGHLLTELTVLSVYRGQQIEKGKKSIALALNLQDTSRTLTDADADAIVAGVVDALRHRAGATIRDK
jgi:phenylalanyl-tRNA synthetase beta chain